MPEIIYQKGLMSILWIEKVRIMLNKGKNGLFYACDIKNIDLIRFLSSSNIDLEIKCNEGNTPLHSACTNNFKEGVLFLLLHGANYEEPNSAGQKPGEGNMEMKMFLNKLVPEAQAFKALNLTQRKKLQQIFEDIDFDNAHNIDLEKSMKFDKYIDSSVEVRLAEKDAKDFIKSCAICNGKTVNLEEWIFAFSKLFALDIAAYEKFIEDYDNKYKEIGSVKEFAIKQNDNTTT